MEPDEPLILRSPKSPDEWDACFDLRWRILRQPWGQPRGSARDSMDDSAVHLLLLDSARKPLACGRLHFNAPDEAQVRFLTRMRVVPATGVAFSRDWRLRRRVAALRSSVSNARDNVTEFYAKHDYAVVGEAETLFGVIRHVLMEKSLS